MMSWDTTPLLLNLATRWIQIVCFTPRSLYSRAKSFRYRLEWGCLGPRVGLDAVVKRKNPTIGPA